MSIVNFGTKIDKFEEYLSQNTTITNIFPGGISAGKPVVKSDSMSLYFGLTSNNILIDSSRTNGRNLIKRALVEFIITTNKKDIAHVEIYEALDTLSNEICNKEIDLDGFIIKGVSEGNQSGVLIDSGENPLLIATYEFDYIAN